nr:hypothetical protein [Tanacetum cinerariifolium]
MTLLSSSASASKASIIKNKGLIVEAYESDEEEVSSDDIKMVELKVFMALAEENDVVSKEGAINGQKDLVFVKFSADDTKVTILGVERPWLSEGGGFILPNHDTSRILPVESKRNITDPLVVVTNSSTTIYDSADESSVYSTPLPQLNKLDGAEPIFGPKTIKSVLRSKSTFKAKSLKDVIINEPSLAPAKGNKRSSTLKVHSAPAGKLKSVKIKDDPPLAIVMKELNNLKLQVRKNQSSYSINYVEVMTMTQMVIIGLSLWKERSIQEILNMHLKDVKFMVAQLIPQLITMILKGSKEVKHFKPKRLGSKIN